MEQEQIGPSAEAPVPPVLNPSSSPVISQVQSSRKSILLSVLLGVISFGLGVFIYFRLTPPLPEKVVPKKNPIPDTAPALLITPTPTKAPVIFPTPKVALPDSVNNSSLYYQDGKKLYIQSPLLSPPTVFLEQVDSYAFSPDKKFIAYIKEYGPDSDNDVNILNIDKKTSVVIPGQEVNRSVDWSPDGKYVVVDAGTGPDGSMTVYDAFTGKEIMSFADGQLLWYSGLIYMTQSTAVETPRPWDTGNGRSVVMVDISNRKSKVLVRADDNNDYHAIRITDGCLYYSRSTAESQEDWTNSSKIVSSTNCYNLSTGVSTIVSNKLASSGEDILRTQIEKAFPEYDRRDQNNYFSTVRTHPRHQDWVIAEIYHGESVYMSSIVIFNLKNPRDTFQKITTGTGISWH
jgi:hypothetical protein